MNTSSLQETQQVIDDIHREIKKGKLGDFVVDPGFSMDPVVTMKVPLKQEPSSSAICTTEPTNNLILIIILGVAVGLLFVMFIVIIVLAIRIRKGFHRSSSYSLKPVGRSHEYDVNY
ncbi:uncharacterized protein LOC116291738 [Actinia tenebrosa]|nr:uncharacterized protein LOC116291738 [Actinia tenebrosa]